MHEAGVPSEWIVRWGRALLALRQNPPNVLDVACGSGRHVRWWLQHGAAVTAVDRDAAALAGLRDSGAALVEADLEGGPWPLPGQRFDAVVVTNYLWRPLLPALVDSVTPGGWLLYETFAQGQQTVGRPSRAAFLLAPGELLNAARAGAEPLRIVAFEDGFEGGRFVQRIAAVREAAGAPGDGPVRYPL